MTPYELLSRIAQNNPPKRIRVADIDTEFLIDTDGNLLNYQKKQTLDHLIGDQLTIEDLLTKDCIEEVQGLTSVEYNLLADIRIFYQFDPRKTDVIKKSPLNEGTDESVICITDGVHYCGLEISSTGFTSLEPYKEYKLVDLLDPDFH